MRTSFIVDKQTSNFSERLILDNLCDLQQSFGWEFLASLLAEYD